MTTVTIDIKNKINTTQETIKQDTQSQWHDESLWNNKSQKARKSQKAHASQATEMSEMDFKKKHSLDSSAG